RSARDSNEGVGYVGAVHRDHRGLGPLHLGERLLHVLGLAGGSLDQHVGLHHASPLSGRAGAPPAPTTGQKSVRRNGSVQKGERRSWGLTVPSSSPFTRSRPSASSTALVARAKAGSASAGAPA